MLCVNACGSGQIYYPVPASIATPVPSQPTGVIGNANDANSAAAPDLHQTPLRAPTFQPSIDGTPFVPQAVFYATGTDPANNPVFVLVVSDQNNLCTQLTQSRSYTPGASMLTMYLYNVASTGGAPVATSSDALAGSYAVFDSAAPNGDISLQPALDLPSDTGRYASGMFATLNTTCGKTHTHQLAEGAISIAAVDDASSKASGQIQVLLDSGVALTTGGTFVAQACPALADTLKPAAGCTLP